MDHKGCEDCIWDTSNEYDNCSHPCSFLFATIEQIDQLWAEGIEYYAEDCPGFQEEAIPGYNPEVPTFRISV